MADYAMRPDDRGWPMAHRVQPDGTVERDPVGAMIGVQYAMLHVTINGTPYAGTRCTVLWFDVGAGEFWAGDWEVSPTPPMRQPPSPADRNIALEIRGRRASGRWCGENRICGSLPFPLSHDEWETARVK